MDQTDPKLMETRDAPRAGERKKKKTRSPPRRRHRKNGPKYTPPHPTTHTGHTGDTRITKRERMTRDEPSTHSRKTASDIRKQPAAHTQAKKQAACARETLHGRTQPRVLPAARTERAALDAKTQQAPQKGQHSPLTSPSLKDSVSAPICRYNMARLKLLE